MKNLLLILFSLLLFAGCKSHKPTVSERIVIKDSISSVSRIIPRDTLITVPKDSIKVSVKLSRLTEKPQDFISKSGKNKAKISLTGDDLEVECIFEELKLQIKLLDKELQVEKYKFENSQKVTEVPIPYIPWYVKTLAWIGGIFLGLFIIGTIYKTYFNK